MPAASDAVIRLSFMEKASLYRIDSQQGD